MSVLFPTAEGDDDWEPVNDQIPGTKLHDSSTIQGKKHFLPTELQKIIDDERYEQRIEDYM